MTSNNRSSNYNTTNTSSTTMVIDLTQETYRFVANLIDEIIIEQAFDMHWCIKTGRLTWKELYMIEDNTNDVINSNNSTSKKLIMDEVDTPKEPLSKQNSSHSNTFTKSNTTHTSNNGNGNHNSNGNGMIVSCPICYEQVSGLRFANHLEKCMRGGKRGARGSRPFTELSLPYISPKIKVDPHPLSLIIRIKMKNGVVKPGQVREGVTLEEFQRCKQMEENAEIDEKVDS